MTNQGRRIIVNAHERSYKNGEKYLETLYGMGEKALQALIIIVIGYVVYKIFDKLFTKFIEKSSQDEIVLNFFKTIIKTVFIVIIAIMALSQLGINTSSILAIFTAASAAFALAIKDSLASFFDGIIILLAKPFSKGDLIEVVGVTGRIQEISLLYTNLLTLDNKKIVIPNSQLAHSTLVNYSSEEIRRVDLNFDVIMGSDTELVKKVIMEEALSNPYCLNDIPPFVNMTEYKDSALTFTLRVWAATENYETLRCSLLENMNKRFNEEGIELAYTTYDIHLSK